MKLVKIAQVVSENMTFKNTVAATNIAIFYLGVILLRQYNLIISVNSNRPMVREDNSKIGVQDGSSGSRLGFPIGKILYTFDL